MTSGNVNNFVSDLVLMAKAMEELPQIKAELEATKHDLSVAQQRIQDREERILTLKGVIEDKAAAVHKLEAERDDAELRFLESEDRVSSALNFIKTTFGSAGSLIQALEPPAPVAMPTPPAEPEVIHQPGGQEDGMVKVGASEGNLPSASEPKPDLSWMYHGPEDADATMGQGAADPTTATTPASPDSPTTHSDATSVESTSTEGVSVSPSPTSAPVAQIGTGVEQGVSSSDPYYGEPEKYTSSWYRWANEMDAKYGSNWPDHNRKIG